MSLKWTDADGVDAARLMDGDRLVGEWYPVTGDITLRIGTLTDLFTARAVLETFAAATVSVSGENRMFWIQRAMRKIAEAKCPPR